MAGEAAKHNWWENDGRLTENDNKTDGRLAGK